MSPFKAIYWNQYFELKKKQKESAARANGTGIVTMTIVMFLFAIFMLLMTFYPDFERDTSRFVSKSFGRNSGKMIGQMGIILLILIIYPLIKYTIGTRNYFFRTVVKYSILSQDEQKQISKKGMKYFIGSILLFVLSIITMIIKSFV